MDISNNYINYTNNTNIKTIGKFPKKEGDERKEENEKKTLHNINLLDQYINALIVNVNPNYLHKQINLIFDSGAVNGLLGIGAALYIHQLESLKYININKISGCSIGSLIAVWYIKGCSNKIYDNMNILFSHYKTHKNFYVYETIVKKVIYKLFDTDDMTLLNDKLYINYYNQFLFILKQ